MGGLFRVKVEMGGLAPWQVYVNQAALRAANMAGTSAVRAMRAEASRQIRERKAVKVAHIGKAISLVYPTTKEQLIWRVRARGEVMPVASYSHRQVKSGVSVQINVGSRSIIRHAFTATMKSGHSGVFMRYGAATRVAVQRYKGNKRYAGQKRQPIRELYTTKVSEAFQDAVPAIAERGRAVFASTFERVLPLEAAKRRSGA